MVWNFSNGWEFFDQILHTGNRLGKNARKPHGGFFRKDYRIGTTPVFTE